MSNIGKLVPVEMLGRDGEIVFNQEAMDKLRAFACMPGMIERLSADRGAFPVHRVVRVAGGGAVPDRHAALRRHRHVPPGVRLPGSGQLLAAHAG
jgi:hypothetical protein